MLRKLIKYDLHRTYKVLIVFYILSVFFAVLTRVLFQIEGSFVMEIIGKISSGVTISMIFNIVINNMMRLWGCFRQNLYADEAYLTHTLPVKRSTIYLSKFLSSIITLFISVAVIALSLFIAYYSKENLEILRQMLLPLEDVLEINITVMLSVLLFVLFLEIANAVQAGFTGLILGHKMNNSKIGLSVLFGFAFYNITQIIVLAAVFLIALFNKDLMNLFITNEMINFETLKTVMIAMSVMYTAIVVSNCALNIALLKKGVDVE